MNSQPLSLDGLYPVRQWLNGLKIRNITLARFICRIIPVQCPFERDICLWGYTIVHIPPLCKLNPLYEEVVGLRFRALCYLADECGEDVRCYC
ncbi:MAG TPA: Mo-dependent nitrogenase C-terminal domain-containing protein [Elainellaceae cyanobacterium]